MSQVLATRLITEGSSQSERGALAVQAAVRARQFADEAKAFSESAWLRAASGAAMHLIPVRMQYEHAAAGTIARIRQTVLLVERYVEAQAAGGCRRVVVPSEPSGEPEKVSA